MEKPFELSRVLLLQGDAAGSDHNVSVSRFLSCGVQTQVLLIKSFETLGEE